MLKRVRKGIVTIVLVLLLLMVGHGDYRPSALDLAVAPYKYDLVSWELSNFLDKWVHKLGDSLPWNSTPTSEENIARAQEFFNLGRKLRELERKLLFPEATADGAVSEDEAHMVGEEIEQIRRQRREMQSDVEETIESEVGAILSQEGFSSRIGLLLPPVDAVFSSSPHVLVLSPRDRIERKETALLAPNITNYEKERLEDLVLREENLAALVEGTGGVATYPSVVSDSGGLRRALETVAHEWLHHWFFFRPLGQHLWDSSNMNTLNETTATLGGREIGDRAYEAMTGETVSRDPPKPPAEPDPDAFDFRAEMRETRLRTEELLAQGKIEEAEAYMEERRLFFADHGHFIRKINQAFFAFRGTYATNPASISPIGDQLGELRRRSDSLGDFLKTLAQFDSYQEFLDHLAETSDAALAPAGGK